jgi:hypothetical protein
MLIRSIYLSYNVVLAGLLLILIACSFGLQVFYHYRTVELHRDYDRMYKLCIHRKKSF